MKVCEVYATMDIDGNTAASVEGGRELYGEGVGILDDNGTPHVILSVGIDCYNHVSDDMFNKSTILIEGKFDSKRLYI